MAWNGTGTGYAPIVRDSFRKAVFYGLNDPAKHVLAVKENFNTACWSWKPARKEHQIFVGQKIDCSEAGTAGVKPYISAYVHHEMAHAKYTMRDMVALNVQLRKHKIAFALFNLFEDARIEHLWRFDARRKFNWLKYEKPIEVNSPASCFLSAIQQEGEGITAFDGIENDVFEFYQRSIVAKDSLALIPIMAEWVERFKQPEDQKNEGGNDSPPDGEDGSEHGDMGFGQGQGEAGNRARDGINSLMLVELGVDVDDDDVEVVVDTSPEDKEGEGGKDGGESLGFGDYLSELLPVDSADDIPLTEAGQYLPDDFAERVQAAQRELSFELKTKSINYTTQNPSRRLSSRAIARDADAIYRRKLEGKIKRGKANVFFDLSGSMDGYGGDDTPFVHGCVILMALANLARKGSIEGNAVFHMGLSGVRVSCMPLRAVTEDFLQKLMPEGSSEALEHAFKGAWSMAKDANVNICITDGHITDDALDVEAMRRAGIYTVGLYVGEATNAAHMSEWFDKSLARENVSALLKELPRLLVK